MAVDQTWAQLSNMFVYSAMAVYAMAFIAFGIDLSRRGRVGRSRPTAEQVRVPVAVGAGAPGEAVGTEPVTDGGQPLSGGGGPVPSAGRARAAGIGLALTWLAFVLHVAGIVARGVSVHRPPWGNMYEFSLVGSAVVIAIFLGVQLRRDVRFLGTFVVGPVLLTLGAGVTVWYTEAAQLVPALHSYWLVIHVTVAVLASAILTIGFSTAVLQVVQSRRERALAEGRQPRRGAFMNLFPSSSDLERTTYRLHVIAFPLWTFTVMAGAIWAEAAWGRYWGWDPKEVWSFVIWVVYAAYLHARVTRGWDGRRAAYLVFAGFACLLFNFVGVNLLFSGLHSYA